MKTLQNAPRYYFISVAVFVATFGRGARGQNGSVLASSQVLENPFPYDFPNQSETGVELFPMLQCQGLKLEEATVDQLQHWMGAGMLTSQQLVTCYVQRITQTDGYVRCVSFPAQELQLAFGE